ncbi:MAG: hypothetical protein ACR2F8_02835 [Caulobacteraceae bacterium]
MTSGAARYPRRDFADREGAGAELGESLLPADIYIEVRRLVDLTDGEIIDAFAAGAAALAEGAGQGALVAVGDRSGAIEAAAAVTRSCLAAWRKRGRQMTWDELRVLLLGLRGIVLDPKTR